MALTIKRNDTAEWVFTLREDRTPVSLSTATAVVLHMVDGDGATVIDGGAVTPDPDQTTNPGKCTYSPQEADVAQEGQYSMEVEVTWADGTVSTFPSGRYETVMILADLG